MSRAADDWINVSVAAKRLGVSLHTAYGLIHRGELHAEVVRTVVRPKGRRSVRLRHQEVDDFIRRAKVAPGELRHLVTDNGSPTGDRAHQPVTDEESGNALVWARRRVRVFPDDN